MEKKEIKLSLILDRLRLNPSFGLFLPKDLCAGAIISTMISTNNLDDFRTAFTVVQYNYSDVVFDLVEESSFAKEHSREVCSYVINPDEKLTVQQIATACTMAFSYIGVMCVCCLKKLVDTVDKKELTSEISKILRNPLDEGFEDFIDKFFETTLAVAENQNHENNEQLN